MKALLLAVVVAGCGGVDAGAIIYVICDCLQETNDMNIFVSHTTGEAPIALALKDFLERTFPGSVTVFVSSDVHDLTPGEKWLGKIEAALKQSQLVLVICSPSSLTRPWINFEAGCAWAQGLDIIPICHSGQKKDQLPYPFSELQALELEEETFGESLITVLCQHLKVLGRRPDVDFGKAHRKLEKAKRATGASEALPHIINSPRERTKLINDDLKLILGTPRVAQETVWTSAFLSTFAIGPDDPYPPEDKDYLKLLLQERDNLMKLAEKGCTIKCIISPANRNHIRHAGIDYAVKRTNRLLGLLRSSEKALESIDWAISEPGVKNLYILGHVSCFEGFKKGIHQGYGLTLRQTAPDVISANISLHSGFFRDLAARTLLKWGRDTDQGGERELLKNAAIRCLEDSLVFLAEFAKAVPSSASQEEVVPPRGL